MISAFSENYSRSFLLCILLVSSMCLNDAIRAKRTAFTGDDIRTEYVGNNRTIWAMFNLTDEQMGRIIAGNNASGKDQTNDTRDGQIFDMIKKHRIQDIRSRIQYVLNSGNSEESQEQDPQHEVAAYPICNAESNAATWLHDNNVTIQFANSIFEMKRENLNLDSAILRLYKINPNKSADTDAQLEQQQEQVETLPQDPELADAQGKQKRCVEPLLESQIRVTVSILQQLRRNKQRKKRICNTIMMNVSKTGWVEIDIKRAINIWESVTREQHIQQQSQQQQQQQQQLQSRTPVMVGWLMLEVHDEEERPLKPGLFFKPPNCEQADLAIPWNYYGPHTSVSKVEADQVPRYPRLDVRLIGYASFAPKNYNIQQNKNFHDNIIRQLQHISKDTPVIDNASTTSNSPNIDNLLDSIESNEMLPHHQHRKRHHQKQQQQQDTILSNEYSNETQQQEDQQQQHRHHHRRQRRHHNHHNKHQHQHHHQQQQHEHHHSQHHQIQYEMQQ